MGSTFEIFAAESVAMYLTIIASIVCLWQIFERKRIENRYSHQLSDVPMPVRRTMVWFTRFLFVAYVLRAAWYGLSSTNALGPVRRSGFHGHMAVIAINRASSFSLYIAFSLVGR